MGLEFLTNLFSALPGTVVYHLLVFLGLVAATGIVMTEWRHTNNPELRPYLIALGAAMVTHLLSVFLAPLYLQSGTTIATLSAPLFYGGELLSIMLLVWAFGLRAWDQKSRRWLAVIAWGWGGLLIVASLQWYMASAGMPMSYPVHSWQVPVWYMLSAVTAFVGAVWLSRNGKEWRISMVAFLLLGIGSILGALGSQVLAQPLLSGEGLGRLFYLIGYPLFAVSLYNTALLDLQSYRQELRNLSQEALRQSQELLFMIETTRSIGETLDLRGMLGRVVNSVAMALSADTVAIFLNDEQHPEVVHMVAFYKVLGSPVSLPKSVELTAVPVLKFALQKQRQMIFGPHDDFRPLRGLMERMRISDGGPLLIQPLTRQERTVGVMVACNDSSKVRFSQEQEHLATTIAVQIAGAVENSRLFQALADKAQELRELLTLREAELRREDAILESMAEGILVLDAEGAVLLVNQVVEEIFDFSREDVLGRQVRELLEDPDIRGTIDLERVLAVQEPMEATFELDQRRIRLHASPVLMENGERLGVVAILQDITREYLAEEAKRGFIASISHELRTPLTAIRGYAEVMLSGMAGALPPAASQFLSVMRENTIRMTSLTDNIISVAEIERGHVGLNYQTVQIQDVIDDLVGHYRERLTERDLTLKKDLPDELPSIEVDVQRLRLILDNLMSNAVHYTYPNGRVTIGCRSIQGTLGEPTFLSVWVSDTGVGIPLDEQHLIWDRFYRVDNPLSLEAGGLGIGLTITKALVEAHGGRVWVDSTVGQGSTFTVLLPMSRSMAMPRGLDVDAS